MEKSFGLLFYLKKQKKYTDGEIPVYLRITVNGASVDISMKRCCDPSKWTAVAGRANGKTEELKSLNAYLEVVQRKVYDVRKSLAESGEPMTAENIKTLLTGGTIQKQKYMLMEVFQVHNQQMAALVGREYATGTLQRYTTSYKHTLAFLQARFQMSDMNITDLNFEFITEYEFWLKSARKCDHNTSMKYLSNFKKVVNRCVRNGWILRDPFAGFKMTKREVERTALTEYELETMAQQAFTSDRLRLVRDIFLFSCYSGLAYADVKKLKRSEIILGLDGTKWVVTSRQKGHIPFRVPLLSPALAIIETYKEHLQC